MIDSGATALFISQRFVKQNNILLYPLDRGIALHNIDGSKNKAGSITHVAKLELIIGNHREKTEFLVTDLGPEDLILGLPWLKRVNPQIEWDTGTMEIPSGSEPSNAPSISPMTGNRAQRREWLKAGVLEHSTDQLWCCGGVTYSTKLAAEVNQAKGKRSFEELVPPEYRRYAKIFSEEESHRLPQHQPWDHSINLKPDAPDTLKSKVYPMPLNEQQELEQFITDNLAKGYIVPSKSPMASPVFFVKKKDGKLRLVQDYRKLNDATIKNRYPLPLATDIINKLRGAKIFTKFDVRWGYHNIRIKEGDEWKAAFVTNKGLFEPQVMFFGLTNSPATFQSLMNTIFADLIAEGKVAVYLDDILIWSNTLTEHRKVVHEVLARLEKHDLYLKPEKCEFEKSEIEYLGLIIRHGEVAMDPIKVKAVAEWPTPRNLKEVRGFIGFANFYRRFIKDFSKLARPLHDLTKKDTPFVWAEAQQQAFDKLRTAFTTEPVLAMWSPNRPTRIEVDASGFATGGVISQKGDDNFWHPIAYRSQSMSPVERNYEIYDREMLAITEALKDWRYFLEGLPEPFEIWTDHKNLEFWRTAQHLTRRQARWALLLADFNFVLIHKPGSTMLRPDPLSRFSTHEVNDAEDNKDQTVLKSEHFKVLAGTAFAELPPLEQKVRECTERETEVAQALSVLRSKGPRRLVNGLLEWEEQDGLLYYKGKLYIPNNKDLRAEIIKTCHDTPTTGHPGKHATLELVSRYYWWPKMASSVEKYVLGCDKCQRYKPAPHPRAILQPQEAPTRPWENVGVDLITQLPASRGYEAIAVFVDHFTDQVYAIPTHNSVTAEQMMDIYYKDIFRLHGIPKKMFSDRGPQFAARIMRALYKRLGIESGITTAYHPEGNGKVERKNQEVETFLRLFCARRQTDWVDQLPAAEFALNSRVHSGTTYSPFELIYGYLPDFTIPIGKRSNIPSLEERLDLMAKARDDAAAALRLTKERMKEAYERNKKAAHVFKPGDKVWLSAKDISIHQATPKLGPRQLGPFTVLKRMGDLDYQLELPHWLKVHPVFHVNRLSPWHNNGLKQPPPPPPEIVDGEEVYVVDKILDSRFYRRKLQYLVRWKGYGEDGDTWEPEDHLLGTADQAIKDFYRKNPAAPRRISAVSFHSLKASFRAGNTSTPHEILADQYPSIYDLEWEDGKYLGACASRGRSVLGGG